MKLWAVKTEIGPEYHCAGETYNEAIEAVFPDKYLRRDFNPTATPIETVTDKDGHRYRVMLIEEVKSDAR